MSDISNVHLALTAQPKSPMQQAKPKVIAVGTTCYVTTTDNRTVLKGYQVWSNGDLVYEITAWKRPFPELNDDEVDEKYAKGEFPLLDGNVARHIIRNCWDEGYATAEEVANDLKSCEWSCI